MTAVIGRWTCLVIDCPDPRALASFYEELLGLGRTEDSPAWVTLGELKSAPRVAFQRITNFTAPEWSVVGVPQQMHLDVVVENLDDAERSVLALGAFLLDGSDKPIGYRVYADPIGHPFCLVTPEALS